MLAATAQFGVPENRRQRGTQFMAGIGDELANAGFARVPKVQGFADVIEHPVEGGSDEACFGSFVGVRQGDPQGQINVAAVELKFRHMGCCCRNPGERLKRPADQEGSDPTGEDRCQGDGSANYSSDA